MKKSKIPGNKLKEGNNFFTENHKTSLKKIERQKKNGRALRDPSLKNE